MAFTPTSRLLGWLLLLTAISPACRSQRAAFEFRPGPELTADLGAPDTARMLRPISSPLTVTAFQPDVPNQVPRLLGRARAAVRSARPEANAQALPKVRAARPQAHVAPARRLAARPGFTDRDAYVLFVAVALLLGAGGILTLVLLSGWLGITLGVLLLLGALFLGLMGGFLGKFAEGKPFSFREFFFSKKKPKP